MQKFRSYNFLGNNQFDIEIPPGLYKAFGLSLEFTNQVGQTLTIANMGQLRLFYRGKRIWEVSLDNIAGLVRRKFLGAQRINSTAGNAGDVFVYVPLHFNDGNVCAIGGDDWYFQFIHADLSTPVSAATLTVLLQNGFGLQRFMPIYNDYSIRTLASETKPERFIASNLAYVTAQVDANHTNFRLDKSGNTIYDVTDEQAEHQTNIEQTSDTYAVAAAGSATAIQAPWVFDLYKDKNLAEVWSSAQDSYGFGVVSTSASVNGMKVEFEPTPLNFQVTADKVASRLQKVDPNAAKLSA